MKLPKMMDGNFEPHFALKHMLKDMLIAGRLGLSYHLELAVATAARDRLLEQEQRGYAEEDFSVIARKYFPEMQLPAVEQDLELFEKPPPIEPAATISSMGEVAAALQPVFDLSARVKLRVSGIDRLRFLNGQLTNDIRKATETNALEACVLNAKGKMDAHLLVHAQAESFLLDADPALQSTLQTRLERYVIADDVQIEDVTARFSIC